MKRLAQVSAAIFLALLAALLLWEFRSAVVLFILSLAVAASLRPLVDRLARRGWPRHRAVLLVYALTLVSFVALIWVVAGPLLDDLRLLGDNLALAYERAWNVWPHGASWQQVVASWMPPPQDLFAAAAGPQAAAMLQGALGWTQSLVELSSRVTIVFVMSLYWGADQASFERLWLSLLPAEQRTHAREIWRAMEAGAGAYIRSELVQSLLAGVLLGLGYRLIGLPYPTLLAIVSALAWLIPWLGTGLALIPVVAVGAASGPLVAVLAAAYTVMVFFGLEFGVEPRLYDRRQYSSLLVVLVVIVLGQVVGVLGLLAAPPLAAALQILFSHLLTPAHAPQPMSNHFEALQARLASVKAVMAAAPEPPSPQLLSLVQRLETLVDQACNLSDQQALDRAWNQSTSALAAPGAPAVSALPIPRPEGP